MDINLELIDNHIQQLNHQLISWRRHFHTHPELSFQEFETSEFIKKTLEHIGYESLLTVGGTGVVATLETNKPGPVIAFRADMDALPIIEETDLDYKSVKAGIMHACGHDGHMAILMGTAYILKQIQDNLRGTIKFIFQPGEETNGGAQCVINQGALTQPDVEAIFALHMIPELPTGSIGIKSGYLSGTDDEFKIILKGKGAHSSDPSSGINAINIAAQVISALQNILSTGFDPFDVVTFSVCKISGGEAINVIPDYVEMEGMIRCIEKKNKVHVRHLMEKTVRSIAESMGGSGDVLFFEGFPAVYNHPIITEKVINVAKNVLSTEEKLILVQKPHLGSEDFANYQEIVPGTMFMLGCSQKDGITGTLHSSLLNINENSLAYGVKMFVAIALDFLKR